MNHSCLVEITKVVFVCTITGSLVYASMVEHHDHIHPSDFPVDQTQTTTYTSSGTTGIYTGTTLPYK